MKSCAITGQRPSKFKFKSDETQTGCKRLKKRLHDQFISLYNQGVRRFYVGGALGVDMWAAEILLRLKEHPDYQDIELVEVLPFEGHDARWDERSRNRMSFLREHSDFVIIVSDKKDQNSYFKRSAYMVNHSDCLLAVYDNAQSVQSMTAMAVRLAHQRGLLITIIDPNSGKVCNA